MHVLVIEDSHRLLESLETALRRTGHAVDIAADGEAGLRMARHNPYDVIVLDLMLPKMDGMTVLHTLRSEGNQANVLILTVRDAVEDRIKGLREGGDDYLVKPFALDELLVRIDALMRRRYEKRSPLIAIGPITVDTAARKVLHKKEEVVLSAREYALLEYLAFRKGQVVNRRQLEDHLYSERDFPMSNAIDRTVCVLRKKLEAYDSASLLTTRRGLGFVLDDPAS